MYWRLRAKDMSASTVAQNRDRLRALAEGDQTPGLVAVDDGRAVGWVSLGPRTAFERLERSRRIPRVDAAPVWSIVCFVVGRHERGHGIARALLDAAVEHARAHGAPAVEAYPVDPGEGRVADWAAYRGTLAMFRSAGFRVVAETSAVSGGARSVVVRRDLT
jgi:GNAT superfamily N-acetyltransferase